MASPDGEMSLGEISRTLQRIDKAVSDLAHELRTDLRETRHKANNALQGVELQKVFNIHMDEKMQGLEVSDERQWKNINDLRENAASQEAVDRYRKWLVSVGLGLGGLGVANFIINIVQSKP